MLRNIGLHQTELYVFDFTGFGIYKAEGSCAEFDGVISLMQ